MNTKLMKKITKKQSLKHGVVLCGDGLRIMAMGAGKRLLREQFTAGKITATIRNTWYKPWYSVSVVSACI